MGNTIDISFIVAVYNVKLYLRECLTSLIGLKENRYEIIIVDDGSTDGSSEICDEFQKMDLRIKVIHQENQGVSVARNTGIKESVGKWIFFVDGDDYVLAENIENHILPELDEKYDIIYFAYKQIIGEKLFSRNFSQNMKDKLTKNPLKIPELKYATLNPDYKAIRDYKGIYFLSSPWGKVYRRQFLIDNNILFVEGIIRSQDLLFNMEASKYVTKVLFLPYEGYVYRRNTLSISNKYTADMAEHCMILINEYEKIMNESKDSEDIMLIRTYSEWKVKQLYNLLKSVFCNPKNTNSYYKRKSDFKRVRNNPHFVTAFQYIVLSDFKMNRRIIVFCMKHNIFWILNLYFRNTKLVQFAQKIMYKIGLE